MDRSRNLLQIGPLAVFEWSPRATPEVTFVSANAEQLLELDVEALRSGHTSLVETIWEADRESFLQELEECRQPTVTVEHRPFRLASRGGVPRWVLAQSCVSAPVGYTTYVFVHAAIEKTETARRESEERYQQIFNTNLAVKLLIDPSDGQIHQANKAAARFYGYSQQQLEQMNISDINTLSDAEVAHEMDLARNEERLFFNFRHRLASGEIRDVEVFSGPVKSQETNLLYSIVFDVTDRHRAIEALEENQKHLSQTLLELEATQGQLVQRERLAAIGQVTAGIAHDFNNLLTGILGTAEMMRLSENLTKADLADSIKSLDPVSAPPI